MAQAAYPRRDSNETISREVAKPSTRTVNLSKLFKEIKEIKARTPDLYEALAKDNPSFIKMKPS
jgi:hypothetical protein